MGDYMVRAAAAEHAVRAFAITSKELTEHARRAHQASPVVSAALGRLLAAGAMMGVMMKGEDDLLTLQVMGDGPVQGLVVTADSKGHVKGYPNKADVKLPPNAMGKLDVGGAIGKGVLRVIRDMGLKEPYTGTTELQTGEIAEDLTYYFATSEQVPSAVGLGVLMNKDNTVRQAGGFMVQLMPFTEEPVIAALEQKIAEVASVTDLLEQGLSPEGLLEQILGEFGLEITEKIPVGYRCDCSRERVTKALISIGAAELQEMAEEGKPIEVNCQFCDKHYVFTPEELKDLLESAGNKA